MSYGTKFNETEALLAAQEGNVGHVREILADMLPGERASLRSACDELAAQINRLDGVPR